MIEEADIKNQSVGFGGRPDRDGNVTLDACIMNKKGDYGAVVYMQNISSCNFNCKESYGEHSSCDVSWKGC